MSGPIDKLFNAIPEASYDLISRILPGGIVVSAAISAKIPLIGFELAKSFTISESVIFLALSYVVGLAISSLVHLIHVMMWPLMCKFLHWGKINESLPNFLKLTNKKNSSEAYLINWKNPFLGQSVLARAHDIIKHLSSEERPVVLKLFAEVSLLFSFSIGLLISLIIIGRGKEYWLLPASFFVAGFIRSISTWYRHNSILGAIVCCHKPAKSNTSKSKPKKKNI